MKEILVRNSDTPALVDDEDYEYLSSMCWRVQKKRNGTCYAVHDVRLKDDKIIKLLMHREVMKAEQGLVIDHINRNGLDNRKSNLRFATTQQNNINRVGQFNSTSIYKGVSWDAGRQKWRAQITHNYKDYKIGRFDSEIEAARAYDRKALELLGDSEFIRLNFND